MTSPVWHPFTQHGLDEPIPVVASAKGTILTTKDGRRIIDAISSWWVTTHGHAHPRITAAIAEQATQLDQIIFAGWTHEPAEQLARELVAMMGLPHVFYSDSGSTAVEVAVKMALGFWANQGQPRHRILVLDHGYHGDTIGAMSVGARGVFNQQYQPLLFDVGTLPCPSGDGQPTLDALDHACRHDAPAALLVEPLVLGAGGMHFYAPAILAEMRRICDRHGVPMIADEVMTGWGRTGTLLACEQAGIVPDLLCLSKGITGGSLPLAVTMASSAMFEAHRSPDRARMFFHSSSYTANPIACAAAVANLAVWRDEPVRDRIADLARRQGERLARIADRVHNPRQLGTITAFEVGAGEGYMSDLAPRLLAHFRDRDVLLRPLGDTVYVMPPYCITDAELDRVYAVIEEVLG
ncbi:adenosylmethionine--8-amino-7-oxononanoate transaminase [Sphingomonas qomolangmaensis]|uniref:Adenosylmethionine-8-amino-7-oxononanoate aminotransferase n=1 Tax=Sphingomonas qomolangmaensis TaxID=2918765 RepID=A0ABY5L5Q3_9SPHN|nr:adenosylmethionine--8-amino-7-oxononanoate transaminase [Sphingomonas qomolangmaensis]UUL82288.1 adenosylmethionine--8-amino-7-oxononanoate transaminase [Sphingomonas qomolangmaensis]